MTKQRVTKQRVAVLESLAREVLRSVSVPAQDGATAQGIVSRDLLDRIRAALGDEAPMTEDRLLELERKVSDAEERNRVNPAGRMVTFNPSTVRELIDEVRRLRSLWSR